MHNNKLEHKLKNRHLQMIALGGVIGTGLFFGSGKSIHLTGPSIILSYLLGGIVIYIILRALGEMTVHEPCSGSFSQYAHTYIGNCAGFISGWSAWFQYTIVCMAELTAVTVFFDYFIPGIPHWILCTFILLFFAGINLINIKIFGEFEFWFAGIKVVVIVLMLAFSAYLILYRHGINPDINQYTHPNLLFAGGYKGFAISFVIVVFSFGGSEFVSIAAGEAENPQKNVPTAINGVIIRILLFYILTMLAIILLYPYQKLSANISPFVDVFRKIGFTTAAGIMNAVAITAALSSFNSCLYAGSRMLFSLSQNGFASKHLSSIKNNNSIPRKAILFTAAAVSLVILINYIFPENAIMYLLTATTGSILIVWMMILVTQMTFRKTMITRSIKLKYKLILFPYSNIFAMLMLIIVMVIMTQMDDMRISVMVAPMWLFALVVFYILNKKFNNTNISNKHEL
ncbi:MAG: amino acid transporter, family [Pseudomonadota bacterium]|nr:amino acid transporter, family [Pseudomonadota bacterium]